MIAGKIEARSSSVRSRSEAAFRGSRKGTSPKHGDAAALSLLGRRERPAGLSRKWSAIEYKRPGTVSERTANG